MSKMVGQVALFGQFKQKDWGYKRDIYYKESDVVEYNRDPLAISGGWLGNPLSMEVSGKII